MNIIVDNQKQQLSTNFWEGTYSHHLYSEVLRFGDNPIFGLISGATKMDISLNSEKIKMGVDNAY